MEFENSSRKSAPAIARRFLARMLSVEIQEEYKGRVRSRSFIYFIVAIKGLWNYYDKFFSPNFFKRNDFKDIIR